MQLKGLVRFFTILLIIYSLYQLSFTFFVRSHEKKMEARAKSFVKNSFQSAEAKYPNNKDSQAIYQETLDKVYQDRLKRLLDSTKDVIVTYGINGAMSYQKAKEEELNLGLDLQGGMNVTLEVEMTGLIRSLANNSKDPNFLLAIQNADKRKANSGDDFITLFIQEYRKLEPNRPLASLFAGASSNKITINSSDNQVENYIHSEALDAFDRTFRVLRTRIDQFGVAQPTINPNRNKGMINVELPGIKDKERVRKILQTTANLQFWETYTYAELVGALQQVDNNFDNYLKGNTANDTTNKADTTAQSLNSKPADTTSNKDTNLLSKQLGTNPTAKNKDSIALPNTKKRSLGEFIKPPKGGYYIGEVEVKDSGLVREYLESPTLRKYFPADARFAYGIPEKSNKKLLPLYVLKTYGREKAPIEGEAVVDAKQDYNQTAGNQAIVSMEMNAVGGKIWETITEKSAKDKIPIAIVLDNIVYSAPIASEKISGGRSQITGSFSVEEAQDLANILKAGKLPAPAKIIQ